MQTYGYAAKSVGATLEGFEFNRRTVGDNDVLIAIEWAGVCHSDIHQVRDEWGGNFFVHLVVIDFVRFNVPNGSWS